VITGLGVVSALGVGLPAFAEGLWSGQSAIRQQDPEQRPPLAIYAGLPEFDFASALRASLADPALVERGLRCGRRAPRALQFSLVCALQAWQHAGLGADGFEREASALVIAGHNIAPAHAFAVHERWRDALHAVPPSHAMQFLDSDHVGCVSEVLGLRGEGFCAGAASASGNVALIQAQRLVAAGYAERCLVIGALADLSALEWQALRNAGALCSATSYSPPGLACRPFDRAAAGFVYGEAAAAILLEADTAAQAREAPALAEWLGGALVLDANRLPSADAAGQVRAMRRALDDAGLQPADVDYVNAHATSTPTGDAAEASALRTVFADSLGRLRINATKALTGHALYAAGVLEALVSVLQLQAGRVHGNPHLFEPIDAHLPFVGKHVETARLRVALSNSHAFGGINTTLVLGA
jgi:malonyl-ACP decarboxylase